MLRIIPAIVVALLCAAGCSQSGSGGEADAAPMMKACSMPNCRLDADERCQPCFELLGRCCYNDGTLLGKATALAAQCEKRNDCRRCCAECAARSCDAVKAAGDCPNLSR